MPMPRPLSILFLSLVVTGAASKMQNLLQKTTEQRAVRCATARGGMPLGVAYTAAAAAAAATG